MINFYNVSKIYDKNEQYSLENVNIQIYPGEFVFLVGSSGAGKSTFIKLLLREILPSEGTVEVNGYDTFELTQRTIPHYRRNMGIVFQDFRLLPDKTVYENVAFAMEILGEKRRYIKEEVPEILDLVGLYDKAKSYPHELSGGEQQRVGIARAIINNPPIIIADEPTGNLDPQNSYDIMTLLSEINESGTTVIVATHAKEYVDSMQKRVIYLENGIVKNDIKKGTYFND